MRAGDDDVDLAGALADRIADLLEPLRQRRQAGREAGRDRSHRDAGAFQRLDRGWNHGRIDADCADGRRRVFQAERLDQVGAQRPHRLGAEPLHAAGRIVAGKRGEVDAGQRLHQPGGLVFLLHRAPGRQRRGAALDGAEIDLDGLERFRTERSSCVALRIAQHFRLRQRHCCPLHDRSSDLTVLVAQHKSYDCNIMFRSSHIDVANVKYASRQCARRIIACGGHLSRIGSEGRAAWTHRGDGRGPEPSQARAVAADLGVSEMTVRRDVTESGGRFACLGGHVIGAQNDVAGPTAWKRKPTTMQQQRPPSAPKR